MDIDRDQMVHFPPLGLEIPEDHPDRNKYFSMKLREKVVTASDVSEITLMSRGDILFLYTDGVYDGSDEQSRRQIEKVIGDHKGAPAKEICNAILAYAVKQDEHLRQIGEQDRIDDKTAFIIKHS
jgi:serine/threonine protein phosphatase PrpC